MNLVRVYRYPSRLVRLVVVDLLAAAVTTAACVAASHGEDGTGGAIVMGVLALPAIAASFQAHRKRRAKIWLYEDRVAWTGFLGKRREASLDTLGKTIEFPSFLLDARGRGHYTPNGFLCFSEDIEGFGDLARRLEGAHLGWVSRTLPPSRMAWPAASEVFRYGGMLKAHAVFKLVGALVLVFFGFLLGIEATVLAMLAAIGLAAWAFLDVREFRYARIERRGDQLVQIDRWNRPVHSVHLSTMHYVTTQETGEGISGRIEGDDGAIVFGRHLEGGLELVRAAYEIIADRHRTANRIAPAQPPNLPIRSEARLKA